MKIAFSYRIVCIALLLGMTIMGAHAIEPNNKIPSSDVPAHWVHLKGHFGKNAERRTGLIATLNNCVGIMRKSGMPHQEVPADQIPLIVNPVETDLYIAYNRVMKISHNTLNSIDPTNCSITVTHQDNATLASMRGFCYIDLTGKTATGVCDQSIHSTAPPLSDLIALHEKGASAASKARLPIKTGEKKLIAGLKCDVYKSTFSVPQSYCISNAGSFVASPLLSFTGIIPGLPLEVVSEYGTNQIATEAHFDTSVSPDLFAVAKDIKVKSAMPGAIR